MNNFGTLDWIIVIVYFVAMASIGPFFARRNKSTEGFFVGDRSFPAWLLGLAMFATSISSVTVVANPADSFKTAYLRLLPSLMLPVAVYIAARVFLPYFRQHRCTSAFEFLEGRFGPGVRLYAAIAFVFAQIIRISTILYLVSIVFQEITGQSPYVCILAGGVVIAIYTVAGGMRAIVTAQFVQAFLLWFGAILCFTTIVRAVPGGLAAIIQTGLADGKISFQDRLTPTGPLMPTPWFSFQDKAIIGMLVIGLTSFLTEYSSNQNVIQKYVSAKNPLEATKAIWICVLCSVPTWVFFKFVGTSLYVFYKTHPDAQAAAILAGTSGAKAESILPYFCVHNIPTGVLGLVITGILAAAMSASSSSVNAISAVSVTDIYRRHIAGAKDERHYVVVARLITLASTLMMMGGAAMFQIWSKLTLSDTGTKLGAIFGGGLLGIYVLGFLSKRGDGRAVGIGIVTTLIYSAYIAAIEMKLVTKDWFMGTLGMPDALAGWLAKPMNTYYAGIFGNIIVFVVAYCAARWLGTSRRAAGAGSETPAA